MGEIHCRKCLEVVLILKNIIMFILGVAVIVLGILALYDFNVVTFIMDSVLYSAVLTFFGCTLCILAVFGLYGVCANNKVFMILYSIFIGLFLVIHLVIGILAFVQMTLHSDYDVYVKHVLKARFEEYKQAGYLLKCALSGMCEHIVDLIQFQWKCCGLENRDFWTTELGTMIPGSCCLPESPHPCQDPDIFEGGCAQKGYNKFKHDLMYIGIAALLLALFYLFIFIIILYLICTFYEEYYIDIPTCMVNEICF